MLLGLAHHAGSRGELVELLSDERAGRHAALALAIGADHESAEAVAERIVGDDALQAELTRDLEESPWSFLRGREDRLSQHVSSVMRVRNAGYSATARKLCESLTSPPEGFLVHTQRTLARHFLHQMTSDGQSDDTRLMAAEALACMGARSAVLSVRDTRSTGADAARIALSDIRGDRPTATE